METKICKQCTTEKPLEDFHLKKDTRDGYAMYCKTCKSEIDKQYRLKNKNILKKKNKDYYNSNKETLNEKQKLYVENNKEKTQEYQQQYRIKNRDKKRKNDKLYKANNRDKLNLKEREKNQTDPIYKLKNTIRKSILKKIKQQGFAKNNSTTNILGCSYQEFKEYIESKWQSWMTWGNHGKYNGQLNYGWDLDHIIPINSATTEEDMIRLNHYTNFQPLCSKINRDIKWKN